MMMMKSRIKKMKIMLMMSCFRIMNKMTMENKKMNDKIMKIQKTKKMKEMMTQRKVTRRKKMQKMMKILRKMMMDRWRLKKRMIDQPK